MRKRQECSEIIITMTAFPVVTLWTDRFVGQLMALFILARRMVYAIFILLLLIMVTRWRQ